MVELSLPPFHWHNKRGLYLSFGLINIMAESATSLERKTTIGILVPYGNAGNDFIVIIGVIVRIEKSRPYIFILDQNAARYFSIVQPFSGHRDFVWINFHCHCSTFKATGPT